MASNFQQKRRQKDVTRIMVSGHDVELIDEEKIDEFIVKFKGPSDSPYFGVSYYNHIIHFYRENGKLELFFQNSTL